MEHTSFSPAVEGSLLSMPNLRVQSHVPVVFSLLLQQHGSVYMDSLGHAQPWPQAVLATGSLGHRQH